MNPNSYQIYCIFVLACADVHSQNPYPAESHMYGYGYMKTACQTCV